MMTSCSSSGIGITPVRTITGVLVNRRSTRINSNTSNPEQPCSRRRSSSTTSTDAVVKWCHAVSGFAACNTRQPRLVRYSARRSRVIWASSTRRTVLGRVSSKVRMVVAASVWMEWPAELVPGASRSRSRRRWSRGAKSWPRSSRTSPSAGDLIRAHLRSAAAATCRLEQWDCRQLLDRDCLVFDRFIERLRIAGPKAPHTLRVCGIELVLGGASRLSAGDQVHSRSRIAGGAKVFLFSASLGRFPLWFVVVGHSYPNGPLMSAHAATPVLLD